MYYCETGLQWPARPHPFSLPHLNHASRTWTTNIISQKLFNYRPQRSCGKVMFLHLSVILFTGGSSPPLGRHSDPSPGQTPAPGKTPPGQTPPWADIAREDTPPGQTTTPRQTPPSPVHTGTRSTSGRYASYWNVFLLYI